MTFYKCISFFSQTSYEIISQEKPLALVRTSSMSVAADFESEFKDHLVPLKSLEYWITDKNIEKESKKSLALRSSETLGFSMSSSADVILKMEVAIAKVHHLASQKNSGCFFPSRRVTNVCSSLAISCRGDDFC